MKINANDLLFLCLPRITVIYHLIVFFWFLGFFVVVVVFYDK